METIKFEFNTNSLLYNIDFIKLKKYLNKINFKIIYEEDNEFLVYKKSSSEMFTFVDSGLIILEKKFTSKDINLNLINNYLTTLVSLMVGLSKIYSHNILRDPVRIYWPDDFNLKSNKNMMKNLGYDVPNTSKIMMPKHIKSRSNYFLAT